MRLSTRSKRSLIAGVALVLGCGWVWSQAPAGPVGASIPGDVNGDGSVDIADVRLALEAAVGALPTSSIHPVGLPNGQATSSQIQRGRYLVISSSCADCHNRGSVNPNDPNWLAGFITGGMGPGSFAIGPFTTYAANLTPDPDTGLGKWTAQDIFNALSTGKDPNGHFLCPPMPWPSWREKSDDEIWAIAAYLKSIKPVKNLVPESQAPAKFADGSPDWSSSYTKLPPGRFTPYPGSNE